MLRLSSCYLLLAASIVQCTPFSTNSNEARDLVLRDDAAKKPAFVEGDTAHAPYQDGEPPEGYETYKPTNSKTFNMADFNHWIIDRTKAGNAAKWLKVEPGTYEMYTDTSKDGNIHDIVIAGLREENAGWTIDFRNCTFIFNAPVPETEGNPPSAVYVCQSTELTILGGTFWINAGELYSQGKVTAVESADGSNDAINKVTITVDKGYDIDVWSSIDYTKLNLLDISDSGHYVRSKTTFWGENPQWSVDTSARTVSATVNGVGYKKGMAVSVPTKNDFPSGVSLEMSDRVTVKGLTTNGGFYHYGLHTVELPGETRQPCIWKDCLITNPPPTALDMPKRVNGPTNWKLWSGRYDADFDDHPDWQSRVEGSFWQ